MSTTLNALIDGRSEPDVRRVLDDYSAEHGYRQVRLGVALQIAADADATADGAADGATDATDGDATAADADATADGAATDATDATDAADADATADGAATDATDATDAAIKGLQQILTTEPDMRDGLKIVQLPGGYYGYSVTRIGWVRRVAGDEYELVGGRTMAREGAYSIDGITKAAAQGPKGYKLSVPDEMPEELHRLLIRRGVVADPKAWAEACPRPKGWVEER